MSYRPLLIFLMLSVTAHVLVVVSIKQELLLSITQPSGGKNTIKAQLSAADTSKQSEEKTDTHDNTPINKPQESTTESAEAHSPTTEAVSSTRVLKENLKKSNEQPELSLTKASQPAQESASKKPDIKDKTPTQSSLSAKPKASQQPIKTVTEPPSSPANEELNKTREEKDAPSELLAANQDNSAAQQTNKQGSEIVTLVSSDFERYFTYPRLAKRRGWEGKVVLSFTLLNGQLNDIKIEQSSGHSLLDNAAVSALQKVRLDDKMVHTERLIFPVIYELR